MLVYSLGTILSVLLGLFYQKVGRKLQSTIILKENRGRSINFKIDLFKYIPMLPLIIISGIRYGVGQDYFYTYVPIFRNVLSGKINGTWGEIGYIYLNKFVTLFTSDYSVIFLLTSIIFIYFTFKAIYEQSDNISFSIMLLVLMGYYFCFMNGIRQMLAASILIYSIKFIKEKKLKKFLIFVLMATMLHTSSLLFIPLYFISSLEINYKIIAVITFMFYALSNIISSLLLKIIGLTKYSWYLDSTYKAERTGFIMILINFMILVFALIFNKDKKNDIYIKIQWFAVLSMAFIGKIPVAHRLLWVFGLPGIILIPNIISSRNSKRERFVLTLIISILYIVYFIYTVGIKNSNSVLPYRTIFNK